MNISIVKITPSKRQKHLAFVDVRLEDAGILIKGLRIVSNPKDGMLVLLPSLPQETGRCYSPFTFLSKDMHKEFINTVKTLVSKLLNI